MSNLSELLPSGGGQNQVEFVASGTLPNGKPVVLNSNGTVSVISGSGGTLSSAVSIDSANAGENYACYDTVNNKIVVINKSTSGYGRAVVGTVSGGTISFGTPVVFASTNFNYFAIEFDQTSGKVLVVYADYSNTETGMVIVGTVSGTSISFGSVVNMGLTKFLQPQLVYDPDNGRCVMFYSRNSPNVSLGAVITISGTTPTLQTPVAIGYYTTSLDATYDTQNNKMLIAYINPSNRPTCQVVTVSGNTMSFGTAASVATGVTTTRTGVAYHVASQKHVVAYSYNNLTRINVATISGTNVTFGTEVTTSARMSSPNTNVIYSAAGEQWIILARDQNNSYTATIFYGTVSGNSVVISNGPTSISPSTSYIDGPLVYDPDTTLTFLGYSAGWGASSAKMLAPLITNLTSTNLIGISAAAASSGATAKINTWGGINEAQSSLTIASDYYVQTDGTITTATGGQKVGQAISATTINMRNQP